MRGKDEKDLQDQIDEVIPQMTEWFHSNRLSLNTTKTFYQVFPKTLTDRLDIQIDRTRIDRKKAVKYLGITVEESLKWQIHISNISKSISRGIGVMGRAKYFLSSHHLVLLYNTLVLPYLNYCAVVWGSNYSTRLDKIVKLQKRVVRVIDNKPFFYPTKELFSKYRILKFPDIVKEQQIIILLGFLNQTLPIPISEMFSYHEPANTRAVKHFKVPFAPTNYKMFSLSVSAPRIWNSIVCSLFPKIEDVPRNKVTLKKHIRKFLIDQYK